MIRASMSSTVPAQSARHWGKPLPAPGKKRGSASRFRRASLGETRRLPRRLTRWPESSISLRGVPRRIPLRAGMAYRDAVRSVTRADGPRRRLPAWAVAEGPFGVRLFDVGIVALVIAATEINVITGSGPGAVPLNLRAYLLGALLAVPILFRHRWPFQVMLACATLIFFYYIFARRNISPAPVFFVPLYDATLAGYLVWAVSIATGFMLTGLVVVGLSTGQGLASLFQEFLSQIVILVLGVTAGKLVRSREVLAAETATRLRLAEEERAAEAGRVVAEERLRIARELHDTVAHSMATITVQAGSALHLLGGQNDGAGGRDENLRAALTAIRETSKAALGEMRATLGQLRRGTTEEPAGL